MPKSVSELTIIILSYNVEKLLLDCLASLNNVRTGSDKWQVLIVDNASTDNSVTSVRKLFPKIRIIVNKQNLGFAAGNNVALRQITTPYALLLNPDTIIYPNSIQTVLTFLQTHPDSGAATCRVELPDGSLDYSCHRRFPDPWNSFLHFYTGLFRRFSSYSHTPIPGTIHEIDALTGAFALIRTSAGKQVSWLDEDYFWNGEDLDFCYKLKSAGWKIFFIPEDKIIHFKGSSAKASSRTKRDWASHSTDAMLTFYRKHYASRYPLAFNLIVYTGIYLLRTIRIVFSLI